MGQPSDNLDASAVASRTLATELKKKVRERGLVIWVDAEKQYSDFAKSLGQGNFEFGYPVVAFRGSYLEVMLALEPYANDRHPDHLLVHLAGLNKETVKETPLFELYKAGTVYEKSLSTLLKDAAVGVANQEELDTLLREPNLSLSRADAWFASLRSDARDELSLLLESLTVDEVVLAVVCEDKRIAAHLPARSQTVLAYLGKYVGLGPGWQKFAVGAADLTPDNLGLLAASWLMAVEFVTDLREPPVTATLQQLTKLGPFAKECRRLAQLLRERCSERYEEVSLAAQELLTKELGAHDASALGSIDTFRFEEAKTRKAALDALRTQDWKGAKAFADERTLEQSYWVRKYPALQRAWEVIRQAATTGTLLTSTEKALNQCGSLEEATERYVEKLAQVDRAHRLFEQRSHALLSADLEDYDALHETRSVLRTAYRDWANTVNRAFYRLCCNYGALPARNLRQRTIYEDVVQPLIEQGGRIAYILVDALRFEMALGLADDLKKERYQVNLAARLAELPTNTEIGMNALAPVERNGRLKVVVKDGAIRGFATSEFQVCDPAARVRTMSDRSLGSLAEDIELESFQEMSLTQLKRRLSGKPRLVVVRSRELDTAGEHGLHLGTFDQTLAQLKSALSLLSQAGVDQFVIVSDHGYLLQDAGAEQVPFGSTLKAASRRHALVSEPTGMSDVLEVRLSDLEYETDADKYLVLRPDVSVWQTKTKIDPFVHGGNSLQERVIPVLMLERQQAKGKTTSKYEVVAHAEPAALNRQRLKIAVRLQNRANASLGFLSPKTISLALRVQGRPDISITLLDARPPASVSEARILVPPNKEEALVEFELQGEVDEKIRVEVFHPDGVEDVTPRLVEGFFDVARNRSLGKLRDGKDSVPPESETHKPKSLPPGEWAAAIEDAGFRRVFEIIEERRSINESELQVVLGSARRVNAFSRAFLGLKRLLPFDVEIRPANFMKVYVKKD